MSHVRNSPVDGEHRRVELPGSRSVVIRPMHGTDAPDLLAMYAALDDDDVYFRFFTGFVPPDHFIEEMSRIEEHGGFGLVAILDEPDGTNHMVGEATYALLPDGNGELGITVTADARGWLGPYLLDALVEEAAARGVPNLEADVLALNRRMLSLLRSRGLAVMGHDEQPAVLRVIIATSGRVPTWPGTHDRPRLLLEVPGGRWHAEDAATKAGFAVLACPGPARGWPRCPALRGESCPLVAGADLVVDAIPGEPGRSLLEAHHRRHPSVPVCAELVDVDDDPDGTVSHLPPRASDSVVIGILQRRAKQPPEAGANSDDSAPDTSPSNGADSNGADSDDWAPNTSSG